MLLNINMIVNYYYFQFTTISVKGVCMYLCDGGFTPSSCLLVVHGHLSCSFLVVLVFSAFFLLSHLCDTINFFINMLCVLHIHVHLSQVSHSCFVFLSLALCVIVFKSFVCTIAFMLCFDIYKNFVHEITLALYVIVFKALCAPSTSRFMFLFTKIMFAPLPFCFSSKKNLIISPTP